jgi:hypothetical protein
LIGAGTILYTDAGSQSRDITYNPADGMLYILNVGSYFKFNPLNNTYVSINMSSNLTIPSTPTNLAFYKNRGYLLQAGTLLVGKYDTGVSANLEKISTNTSSCSESVNFTVGTTSSTIILDSWLNDNVYRLFNDLFDILGRRKVVDVNVMSYFERLNHDGDGDEYETGGKLSSVQSMLGPQGIGSLFWDYPSCAALKTAVTAAPITRSIVITKPNDTKQMNVSVTATHLIPAAGLGHEIPHSMCESTNPSASSCPTHMYYDLQLSYEVSSNDGSKESGRMKLLCGQKIGEFERAEINSGEESRSRILYNTNWASTEYPRYEIYERDDEPLITEVQVTRAIRPTTGTFFARTVESRIDLNAVNVFVKELHKSGGYFISGGKQRSSNSVNNFLMDSQTPMLNSLRVQPTLQGVAPTLVPDNCMDINNSLVSTANATNAVCNTYPTPAFNTLTFDTDVEHNPFDIVQQADISNGALRYPSVIFTLPAPTP